MNKNLKQCGSFILASFMVVSFFGCSKKEAQKQAVVNEDKVIAYVNKEPVHDSDLQRSLRIRSKMYPQVQISEADKQSELNGIIERKIIVQQAIKKGLIEKQDFIDAIKLFWEQALIKEFLKENAELYKNKITVTDEEINQLYAKLEYKVTFRFLASPKEADLVSLNDRIAKGEDVSGSPWRATKAFGYLEVGNSIFAKAFDLDKNKTILVSNNDQYFLIQVLDKVSSGIGPLSEVKPKIQELIAQKNEQKLFADWIASQKEQSEIEIVK